MHQHRRQFLTATGSAFAGLALSACVHRTAPGLGATSAHNATPADAGNSVFGLLQKDPEGLLDLPAGFSYRIVSRLGQTMKDGFLVPDRADGMGCFDLGGGEIALVRNHELQPQHDGGGVTGPTYDSIGRSLIPLPGGTTTIVLDAKTLERKRQFRTLAGTIRNCSGGTTPWGSWLSCEESVDSANGRINKNHGFVFEVPANAERLIDPVPLTAMGRFNHEAACVDPETGIVYLTEDRNESLFYRFIPNEPGNLLKGGILQALALDGLTDTRNWGAGPNIAVARQFSVRWITLDGVASPDDDLRLRGAAKGATVFARGEGLYMGEDEMYFTATSGGRAKEGQIFRLRPSRTPSQLDSLELFFESSSVEQYNFGDNLCVAPYGHLVVCEDQYTQVVNNFLRGITPEGASYPLAKLNAQTELAGACFSPDGQTLFVNAYSPSATFAIQGQWPS